VGKEDKGTGLGLAVAKKIIENHRGTIKVISKRGKQGRPFTRFVVTLPKKLEMYGV
jgi:signal transduction histidine kinase